jgi:hypothetical protein
MKAGLSRRGDGGRLHGSRGSRDPFQLGREDHRLLRRQQRPNARDRRAGRRDLQEQLDGARVEQDRSEGPVVTSSPWATAAASSRRSSAPARASTRASATSSLAWCRPLRPAQRGRLAGARAQHDRRHPGAGSARGCCHLAAQDQLRCCRNGVSKTDAKTRANAIVSGTPRASETRKAGTPCGTRPTTSFS